MAIAKEQRAVIFGAGLAGRGFLAHLLTISGYSITFVEKDDSIVELMKRKRKYHIHVINNPDRDICIDNFLIFNTNQVNEIINQISQSEIIYTAVGGQNLPALVPIFTRYIDRSIQDKSEQIKNLIFCENYFDPIATFKETLISQLNYNERTYLESNFGFGEGQILRSCMSNPEEDDPLALIVQDFWKFPISTQFIKGKMPNIEGFHEGGNSKDGLLIKLYTYNSISASIAYLGHQKGYRLLSEAANDPAILEVAEGVGDECCQALSKVLKIDIGILSDTVQQALIKFKDNSIIDPIDRNTRDVLRKLSNHDRLIGPSALAISHNMFPKNLITSIVAALKYHKADDPSSVLLQEKIKNRGLSTTLHDISGLDPNGKLSQAIVDEYQKMDGE